jgi:hypothetical protein
VSYNGSTLFRMTAGHAVMKSKRQRLKSSKVLVKRVAHISGRFIRLSYHQRQMLLRLKRLREPHCTPYD